jgi:(S)-sulfolactate dehydrogenase
MAAIIITEFMDEDAIKSILAGHDVLYDQTLVDRRAELLAMLADLPALIVRNRTQVNAELLAKAPKLKAVGRLGVGLDNIDMAACKARGIAVYPATGANDIAVVEYAIGTMLSLLRGAFSATDAVIAGAWPRTKLLGREAAGKQLGIIGFGSIGRKVGALAVALGMRVVAHDPHIPAGDKIWGTVTPRDLDTLLRDSDVVTLHVPFTPGTKNILDRVRMATMKRGAILINVSRGGVLDEAAVADALRSGALGGAALDVFEEEPLPKTRAQVFAACPHLILTPHIGGLTLEANDRVSRMVAEKIRDHLAGGR